MAVKSSKEVDEIVKRYYTLLIRAGFPLEKVILFGSIPETDKMKIVILI